eukprot:jgi/Bigna1/136531/aug1.34_g11239
MDVHVTVFMFLEVREIIKLSCVSKEYLSLVSHGKLWQAMIAEWFEPGTRSLCTAMSDAGKRRNQQVDWRTVFLEMRVMFELKEVLWRERRIISTRLPYNSGREMSACCMMGSMCVAVAGWINRGPCNDVMMLECAGLEDPTTHSRLEWKAVKPSGDSPPPMYGHTATLIDEHRILVYGGMCRGGYSAILSSLMILTYTPNNDDEAANKWSWSTPMTANRAPYRGFHAAAFIPANAPGLDDWKEAHPAGVLAIHGGNGPHGPSDELFFLDIKTWKFSRIDSKGSVPSARNAHRMIFSASQGTAKLFVFGGGSGNGIARGGEDFDDGYSLDLKRMEWRKLEFKHSIGDTKRVLGRGASCMMLDEAHVLFFGGHHYCRGGGEEEEEEEEEHWGNSGIRFTNNLRLLDLTTMKWRYPKKQRGRVPGPRAYHICGVYGTHMVFMGGWRAGQYLSDSNVLSMSPAKWVNEIQHDKKLVETLPDEDTMEEEKDDDDDDGGDGTIPMGLAEIMRAILARANNAVIPHGSR